MTLFHNNSTTDEISAHVEINIAHRNVDVWKTSILTWMNLCATERALFTEMVILVGNISNHMAHECLSVF